MQIKKSVMRVTVLLAKWCWTVILSDRIFYSHWTTIMDSFSYIFFFRQLHLNFCMHYFITITLKYIHFRSRNVQIGSYLRRICQNVWQKMKSKPDVMTSKRHPDVMDTSHHTTPSVRQHFLAPMRHTEIPVRHARKLIWECNKAMHLKW